MDTFSYHEYDSAHNYVQADAVDMVDAPLRPALTAGQRTLLELLPFAGDEITLDDAIDILSQTEPAPYGQIVTLLNRGAIETAFADIRSVDAEIMLRRL